MIEASELIAADVFTHADRFGQRVSMESGADRALWNQSFSEHPAR